MILKITFETFFLKYLKYQIYIKLHYLFSLIVAFCHSHLNSQIK